MPESEDDNRQIEGEELLSSDNEIYKEEITEIKPVRKIRRKKKRRPDEGPVEREMTSKEKRRIEREQRPKKVGSNFYEEGRSVT